MKTLLIVANVPSKNTQNLFDAAVRGANQSDAHIIAKSAFDVSADDVLQADGILIGTTENFGAMSGAIKDFFERIYYPCLEKKQGLPMALYVRAGIDGSGTIQGVERITTGLKWRHIQAPLLLQGDFQAHFLEECEALGATLAEGLCLGIF